MSETIVQALQAIVGAEHASDAASVLAQHSVDQSSHHAVVPDAVVWPAGTAEVSAIVRYAAGLQIPIVGWGAGSSLEGNSIPVKKGIVVNFQRMNRIVQVHENDFQVTVEAGLFYKDMNRQLARYGLFFAPDPGANASLGGMIANNAAGTRTVKYGATRDNVLALEVVLANGEVIHTGSRSVKQSAGYDLTHLFTGSEGTLGLITQATLRLAPIPEHSSAALAGFPTVADAAEAVFGIIGSGITPAAIELLDTAAVRYMNTVEGIDLPLQPHLLLEFHGASAVTLGAELALVEEICRESGADSFSAGVGREERDRLWEGRHQLFEAMLRVHPGETYAIIDVSVPISEYPVIADFANGLIAEIGLQGALFGHAGDGNLHTTLFCDPADAARVAAMWSFNDKVVNQAIALGGTCTGEHGVGIGKQKYMLREHGEGAYGVMKQIKALLDPQNILNPGKVVGAGA